MSRLLAQESEEPMRLFPVMSLRPREERLSCPRPLLSLSGGLVGGKWRSQTSSLEVQRGSNAYCPENSLSVRNYSHLTFPSQCGVQTCWKGVRKNLLGALEAPVLPAAAVPVIPDVCLQCLPGRHSIPVKRQVQNLTNQC